MFNDKYTDFIFNNRHSRQMKVWITNNNDLKMRLSPSFSNTFQNISDGQNRIYEGVSVSNQDIKLSCAALQVTMGDWRAISQWLSPTAIGNIRFIWSPNHYYNVKLSSISEGEFYDTGIADKVLGTIYNITFEVTFTTVYDWAALGTTITSDGSDKNIQNYNNDYVLPACLEHNGSYYLMNYGNYDMYPDFLIQNVKTIKDDKYIYFNYKSTNDKRTNTNISIRNKENVVYANGTNIYKVVDNDGRKLYMDVDYEPLVLESGRPELLKCKAQYQDGTLILYANKLVTYERYKPFIIHLFDINVFQQTNQYGIDNYNSKEYGSVDFSEDCFHKVMFSEDLVKGVYTVDGNTITINGILLDNNVPQYLYISLCDYKKIDIVEDGTTSFTVVSQCRDVN